MNRQEFDRWLAAHSASFPGLPKWLRDSPGTTDAWAEALSDADLEPALQATKDMLAGRIETPRGWGQHPAAIRKEARNATYQAPTRQRIDGQETVECPLCHGSGWVSIVHPLAVHRIIQGQALQPHEIRPCSLGCSCHRGRGRTRYKPGWGRWRKYSDRTCEDKQDFGWVEVPCLLWPDCADDELYETVGRLIDEAGDCRPRNYEPTFEEWNR